MVLELSKLPTLHTFLALLFGWFEFTFTFTFHERSGDEVGTAMIVYAYVYVCVD